MIIPSAALFFKYLLQDFFSFSETSNFSLLFLVIITNPLPIHLI